MVSAQVRREQARYAIERGLSQRRACALIGVSRANLSDASKMVAKNGPLVDAMRELSAKYPRFGARRIRVMLGREGIRIGKERCSRIWAQSRSAGTEEKAQAPCCRFAATASRAQCLKRRVVL